MRVHLVIDDDLMREAKELSGLTTQREIANEALRILVRTLRQRELLRGPGKVRWDDETGEFRRDE